LVTTTSLPANALTLHPSPEVFVCVLALEQAAFVFLWNFNLPIDATKNSVSKKDEIEQYFLWMREGTIGKNPCSTTKFDFECSSVSVANRFDFKPIRLPNRGFKNPDWLEINLFVHAN
jgi:hypothetical protein